MYNIRISSYLEIACYIFTQRYLQSLISSDNINNREIFLFILCVSFYPQMFSNINEGFQISIILSLLYQYFEVNKIVNTEDIHRKKLTNIISGY